MKDQNNLIRPDGAPDARPSLRLVALDLDGVVYRGGAVLPGVAKALEEILRLRLDLRYVSNNATAHRRTVSDRLAAMGLPAGPDRVLTSAYATARWLRSRLLVGAPVMVVGESGLVEELSESGFEAFHADQAPGGGGPGSLQANPAAVVVGMDRGFTFAALAAAQKAIGEGALFVATNRDATYPVEEGLMPGAGSIVAAVATAAQANPVLIGKPSPVMAQALADLTGIPSQETMFVGDRVSTDIAMGHAAGMVTVLVLTGVTGGNDSRNSLADYVIRDLSELPALLGYLRG
jgi:4-nitrophenyl phosphatase